MEHALGIRQLRSEVGFLFFSFFLTPFFTNCVQQGYNIIISKGSSGRHFACIISSFSWHLFQDSCQIVHPILQQTFQNQSVFLLHRWLGWSLAVQSLVMDFMLGSSSFIRFSCSCSCSCSSLQFKTKLF